MLGSQGVGARGGAQAGPAVGAGCATWSTCRASWASSARRGWRRRRTSGGGWGCRGKGGGKKGRARREGMRVRRTAGRGHKEGRYIVGCVGWALLLGGAAADSTEQGMGCEAKARCSSASSAGLEQPPTAHKGTACNQSSTVPHGQLGACWVQAAAADPEAGGGRGAAGAGWRHGAAWGPLRRCHAG